MARQAREKHDHMSWSDFVAHMSAVLKVRGFETFMKSSRRIPRAVRDFHQRLINLFVRIATLPYYRQYHFNTRDPLNKIALLATEPTIDKRRLLRAIASWRERKLEELQFITLSCGVLAAAIIGAFSWNAVADAYWLTHGLWHSSLILAVLGILLSASEITVLRLLGPLQPSSKFSADERSVKKYMPLLLSCSERNGVERYLPRKKMVFTWQGPLMMMSYSVCGFLAGLTILVCTPFIKDGSKWSTGHNVATIYLAVLAGGLIAFIFCSFWAYHYVNLQFEVEEEDGRHHGEERNASPPIWALSDISAPLATATAPVRGRPHLKPFRGAEYHSIAQEEGQPKRSIV